MSDRRPETTGEGPNPADRHEAVANAAVPANAAGSSPAECADYEASPLARGEYVSALVHFYRGELGRSTDWRLRLDTTTNWAILSVMGLLTFTLGEPSHPHAAILLGMVLVSTFLVVEARRFRIFDVWRARVRMLEINFYGPILRRDLASPVDNWGGQVADHLVYPTFRLSRRAAIAARLRSNYVPLFGVLAAAWWFKLDLHRDPGTPLLQAMAVGHLPGEVVLGLVVAFYAWLASLLIFVRVPIPTDAAVSYFARDPDGPPLR